MHRHALPFYSFLSTFNTSKHIFIDFVVLLHWTTQQNKSASLRFGLTWQFLKKKKKKKKKHGKVCQARVVSCCPAILLFVFLFFHIIQTKKRRRERSKSNFWKGMIKTNVCCICCPGNSTAVVLDQSGSRGILASWCCCSAPSQSFILHACCLLQQSKSHNTPSIAQAPRCDEARLFIASAASYNQMNKKRYKCVNDELQKAQHGHNEVSCKRAILRQVTCLKISPDLLRET